MKRIATNSPVEELYLWRKFITGDPLAFQELIVSNYRSLVQYGTRFCRDQPFIEDVIQDLFIYLWEHKQDLSDTPANVRNYLFKAFRNRILFELKQQHRFTELPETDDEGSELYVPCVQDMLLHLDSDTEVKQQISGLMAQLPERQREALFLKYYQDCEIQEIADIMGINRQSVSNHLQKAMTFLRHHWKRSFVTSLITSIFTAFLL
ncbi:RNA polymerase subunit sigma-24 [Siphonobacter sp. BAB-5405]|uniref:RNA polymerase sigma factor n=1 Tax=Siphonobacter sp. BAB-5405 TaxID=1864825 RepID=UPI000C7FBC5D|nr:sigma-70 family RNA polymerase sigma factor [Siphonobacter sp. BAB-5405]PMD94405.1 RNA polymerase subunit sigma-24 [Siphonobacter sp. BAB-5405]